MSKNVVILERGIRVVEMEIPRKDVADFLRSLDEREAEATLIQALEVGVFCLERARMSQDTDFVRRQLESLLSRVETALGKIPDDTQKALIEKIGTRNGQVLAPIKEMIDSASTLSADKVKEIRTLLTQEIDPAKETTTLGKALKTVRDLLDPKRSDSVQSTLEQAVKTITGKDSALTRAVREVVSESVKPLATEVDRLAKEIRGQQAAEEALQQTTEKGPAYEEEVLHDLQQWAKFSGAEVHYVGVDNRPGDIMIKIPANGVLAMPFKIVIEARDRQSPAGRKAISDTLTKAIAERNAAAGLYVSKTRLGLGAEIGEWAEGTTEFGPFVGCTHENLLVALRWLIIQKRIAQTQATAVEVDAAGIQVQVQRIRTALDRVKVINRKVTDVRSSASEIQAEAEALRDEVKNSVTSIEDALRVTTKEPIKKSVASAAGD